MLSCVVGESNSTIITIIIIVITCSITFSTTTTPFGTTITISDNKRKP